MTKYDKKPVKSLNHPDSDDHRSEALPNHDAYKTDETIVDGGNIDDDNSPLSVSNTRYLKKILPRTILSTDKDK